MRVWVWGQDTRDGEAVQDWSDEVVEGASFGLRSEIVCTRGGYIRELQRSCRWRAKRLFGLSSVEGAFTGTVTVIQRFDSALRLNVHLHTLALDGVYVKSDDGGLRFLRLPRPSEDEVYEVTFRTAKKVVGILEKKGRCVDGASNDKAESDIEPALLSCYNIAGREPKKQIVDGPRLGKGECAVVVDGFNVYSGDAIDGRDRKRVERMCRYLARPPIAMERLTEIGDAGPLESRAHITLEVRN